MGEDCEPREGCSLLEQALNHQVGVAREKLGGNASSAFLTADVRRLKNTNTAAL